MEIAFKIYSPHISSENIELLNSTGIKNISDSIYALSYLQNNARYLLFVISVSSTKINPPSKSNKSKYFKLRLYYLELQYPTRVCLNMLISKLEYVLICSRMLKFALWQTCAKKGVAIYKWFGYSSKKVAFLQFLLEPKSMGLGKNLIF